MEYQSETKQEKEKNREDLQKYGDRKNNGGKHRSFDATWVSEARDSNVSPNKFRCTLHFLLKTFLLFFMLHNFFDNDMASALRVLCH